MKDFFIYFFGVGSQPEFALFTFAHFAPIAVMLATIFLIRRYRDSLRLCRREETIRLALALVCIVFEMSYYWRLAAIPSLSGGVVENGVATEGNGSGNIRVEGTLNMTDGIIRYGKCNDNCT